MSENPNEVIAAEHHSSRVAGVLAERDGYAQSGNDQGVADCDAELDRLGYVDPEAEADEKPKAKGKAKGDDTDGGGGA